MTSAHHDRASDARGSHDRLPYSRPFALAGFTQAEAEEWRRAGWHDAEEAARWRHLAAWCAPQVLRPLAEDGIEPVRVEWVVRFAPGLTAEQIRARLATSPELPDLDIDLRERVLENLRRP